MQFDQIRTEVKNIVFDELRRDCDNYFEGVILKDELTKLMERLNRFFGSPAWPTPSRGRLSFRMQEAVNDFGGIQAGQTLYFWNQGADTLCAMLWPWQDGEHTTLKLIKK